jgi:HK97 gp10 family phage protein
MSSEFHDAAFDALYVEQAEKLVRRACVKVEGGAKRRCPVDTGRLRASITHEVSVRGRDVTGRVGTNVEYARYVEFGTRRMRARPYLRPALGDVKDLRT